MKSLGLTVSWSKTTIQEFGDQLEPVCFLFSCDKDLGVTESFTSLDSVVHNSCQTRKSVNGLAWQQGP